MIESKLAGAPALVPAGTRRIETRWIEAHFLAVLTAVSLSVAYALLCESAPRIPALDWGTSAPLGMRTFSLMLVASVAITLPTAIIAFLPCIAGQWLAVRLGGSPLAHAVLAVPAALVASGALFLVGDDYTLTTIPKAAIAVNATCGAIAGLVFRAALHRPDPDAEVVPG